MDQSADHKLSNDVVEFEISTPKISAERDHLVNLLVELIQVEKDVRVRKAALLEFEGIHTCHMPPKDVVSTEFLQHLLELQIEDPRKQW